MSPGKGFLLDDTLIFETTVDLHVFTETSVARSSGGHLLTNKLYPLPRSSLFSDMKHLLQDESLADVIFLLDNDQERVKAHTQILAARSPVFARSFSKLHSSKDVKHECGMRLISVTDIDAAVFRELMHFIYTDSVTWFSLEE